MLDFFNLGPKFRGDVQIFNQPTTVTGNEWWEWKKPRGCSMAYMMAISGGGGGGGGFTGAAAAARGGGGGGGSSGISRLIIPIALLPDSLFIQVGAGGQGKGSGGGTAGSGVLSYIAISPGTSALAIVATNTVLLSGAAAPTGGGTGTGAAAGAAGTAGTIAVGTSCPLSGLGLTSFVAGQNGTAGGAPAGAAGGSQTIPTTTCLCMGGTGGGGVTGTDKAGGNITAITNALLSDMRPVAAGAGSKDGGNGPQIWKPFFSYCGMGGGASNAGVGGNGGNGNYGSGGGGGGGGTTGGRGGDGGSGLVIIACW